MLRSTTRKALLLVALVALGCDGKKSEGSAPAGPAATEAKAKPAPKEYPSPAAFELKPLAVGQWLRMVVKTTAQPPAQTFVRVVGKEGDAFWLEIEANTPTGTTVVQLLVDEGARKNFQKSAIKKLRIKQGLAPVEEFVGPAITAAASAVDTHAALLAQPSQEKAERADAAVPAGTFKGCYVHDVDAEANGAAGKTKTWSHPAVPIVGFVRSEGSAGGRAVVTELLEMHDEGAKSTL
jgi:hypothetical protein